MKTIVIPHDPRWRCKFEEEAAIVAAALGSVATAIHHIGSTAISGIFAKPIIDMLIESSSLEAIDEKTASLESIGYEAKGEFGIPGRRYFRKDNDAGAREYQIHVFNAGSEDVLRHLAFRDYLLSNPSVAQEYSLLKREISKRFPSDIEAYMDGKNPFIKANERIALAWWHAIK